MATYTLEKMMNSYDIKVLDTCAVRAYLPDSKKENIVSDMSFYPILIKQMELGHLCILPEDIIEELAKVKECDTDEKRMKDNLLGLACRKANRINKSIKDHHGTDISYRVDLEILKDYETYKYTGASREDLSVFEYAKLYQQMGASSAIISNDIKGLHKVWEKYTDDNKIPFEKFGFFYRSGRDLFKSK